MVASIKVQGLEVSFEPISKHNTKSDQENNLAAEDTYFFEYNGSRSCSSKSCSTLSSTSPTWIKQNY